MALRRIPIHRVGTRENLFMNGEREPVMLLGLFSFTLIIGFQDLRAATFGLTLWFGGLYWLRVMAKKDPKMRKIYFRQLKYKSYYPARSTPFRDNPPSQGKLYK